MKINKIIAGTLSLCLVGGALPVSEITRSSSFISACAADFTEGTLNELTYKKYSDHVEIAKCVREATSIAIPDFIEGLPVTAVSDGAFKYCDNLTAIKIPDSITKIGDAAFFACYVLKSVELPDSVVEIGEEAFGYCKELTSVKIGSGIKTIDYGAFIYCKALASITIPDSVTSIEANVFDHTAWYDAQPNGLLYVGNICYEYKGAMPDNTQITIKEGTKGIADQAFKDCVGLTSVTIPDSVENIGYSAFFGCTGLTSVTIPEEVKVIQGQAFRNTGLRTITLPKSVEKIGMYAFWECGSLQSITVENPKCEFDDRVYTIPDSTTVYGCIGSTAQAYAKKYGKDFVPLDGGSYYFGDVNNDGSIDSTDASLILSEYALVATTGKSILSEEQKLAADVNFDNIVDASDASLILSYYSYTSTGGTEPFETFLAI